MAASPLGAVPSAASSAGILAAVSGGRDSAALAIVLAAFARLGRLPGRLVVAHVDHGVRPESRDDATRVCALAEQLGCEVSVDRLDLPPNPSEAAMRAARYAALEARAGMLRLGVVATGHHLGDVAETILFRLGRGTGVRGLAGIPSVRRLDRGAWLVRPLLGAAPSALARACRVFGWTPIEDPTNRDPTRARNRIRHRVLPALRARHPEADAILEAVADIARDVTATLEQRARAWLADRSRRGSGRVLLLLDGTEPDASVLGEALRLVHVELVGVAPTRAWLGRCLDLCSARVGRRLAGRGRSVEVVRTRAGLDLGVRGSVASGVVDLHTDRPLDLTPSP